MNSLPAPISYEKQLLIENGRDSSALESESIKAIHTLCVKIHKVIRNDLMIYYNKLAQGNDFPYKLKTRENVLISTSMKKSTA